MVSSITVTEELEAEHRIIQKVVSVMAALQHDVMEGAAPDVEALRQVVEFMRVYGDGLHHGKEEKLLFPALEAKGVPVKGCPIGVLMTEHEMGRRLVRSLDEATEAYAGGDQAQREAIVETLGELIRLYPSHIWKEDFLAFPMSEKILDSDEKARLASRYAEVNDEIGDSERRRLEAMAEALIRAHEHG